MIDKNTFCSSPWLHFRLTYSGDFVYCRWALTAKGVQNIRNLSMLEYFNSSEMNDIRRQLLTGEKPYHCANCYYQDSFGKVSGRQKQLFRSKLNDAETFDTDFIHSPHYDRLVYSLFNKGETVHAPFDFQIDLENTCNSSCIMCYPKASSKLATDYIKLNKIEPKLFAAPIKFNCWASDPLLVKKFVDELKQMPYIDYIHLLGGETLYVESFYSICEALVEADLAKDIIVGTTTNGTVYTPRLEEIIPKFSRGFHLGLSIESTNSLNDYVRYPADIKTVLQNFDKFLKLREQYPALHLTLRITPNLFTICYLDEVIQYMIDNNVTAESCNVLEKPSVLRMELLPDELRLLAINKLKMVVSKNSLVSGDSVVDTRNPSLTKQVISNVVHQYIDFLTNMTAPDNVESERNDLVKFLNAFESLRNNSILDYAPEFTSFLGQHGYVKK